MARAKNPRKIIAVGKTTLIGDFGHGFARTPQKLRRPLQTDVQKMLNRRTAHARAENPLKLARRKMRHAGKLIKRDGFGVSRFKMRDRITDAEQFHRLRPRPPGIQPGKMHHDLHKPPRRHHPVPGLAGRDLVAQRQNVWLDFRQIPVAQLQPAPELMLPPVGGLQREQRVKSGQTADIPFLHAERIRIEQQIRQDQIVQILILMPGAGRDHKRVAALHRESLHRSAAG